MSTPIASVVMPVRNEERHLEAALCAVCAQDVPDGSIEVLIVDGMSRDATREIALRVAERARFPVRVIDNPGRIAATALNIGIAAARADVVVRVDGHCEIPTDYVSGLLAALERTGAAVAGGTVLAVGSDERGSVIAAAMSGPLGHGGAAFRSAGAGDERGADTVAFPAYRKDALLRVGGFDEAMLRNQDDDLHLRMRQLGERIVVVPSLVVRYHCRESAGAVFRQYFEYGYWKVVGLARRRRLTSWRALGPAALVGWVLVSAVAVLVIPTVAVMLDPAAFVSASGAAAVVFVLLQLIWLVPLSLAARWTSPKTRGLLWSRHCVSRIVTIMHIAYGLGFWRAILRGGRPPEATT